MRVGCKQALAKIPLALHHQKVFLDHPFLRPSGKLNSFWSNHECMQLEIQQLTKVYPNGVRALDNLSLQIGKGMFGLLGPNGAGKSTLMRCIATLQAPDTGQILFEGQDVQADKMHLRRQLGYLPQEFGVYPRMSAERLLDYLARLKGVRSAPDRRKLIDYCLDLTNLQSVRKKHVSGYSGGMRQRFGIAQLLLNNPRLIIVDEPTAGLDPAERQRFLGMLKAIGTEHVVIFSTHIVEDIRDLCTDMAIMHQGRILLHQSPGAAIEALEGQVWQCLIPEAALPDWQSKGQVLSATAMTDRKLRLRLRAASAPDAAFQATSPTLEDVYFSHLPSTLHA